MGLKRSIRSVFIILFLILGEGLLGSSAFSIHNDTRISCNNTFTNCLFDNDEYGGGEFLMPYPVAGGSRWLLQKEDSISYGALKTKRICDNDQYGDCLQGNDQKNSRPCTDYNRCKRGNPM